MTHLENIEAEKCLNPDPRGLDYCDKVFNFSMSWQWGILEWFSQDERHALTHALDADANDNVEWLVS